MKRKVLILASAAIITMASVGGYAFAQGTSEVEPNNNQSNITMEEPLARRNYNNHCWNDEEMIQTMKENGFEDMAQWMEEGNFKSMNQFMNNMSEEDYEKMIELMNENGYGNMWRIRNYEEGETRTNMHNSMMGGRGNRFGGRNMMGRFQ